MNRIATHPETSGRVLLVTGVPGVGKTTVIRELVRRLAHRRLSGFYTEEMRQHGQRVGFRLATLDGEWTVMAHMDFRGLPQVSKYGVDVPAIDAVATRVLALKPGVDIQFLNRMFQSTPGIFAGRYWKKLSPTTRAWRFNPLPAYLPGDTLSERGCYPSRVGFNPLPAYLPGDT